MEKEAGLSPASFLFSAAVKKFSSGRVVTSEFRDATWS
jgi:hypothetical protein